jgi:hypothetical protein
VSSLLSEQHHEPTLVVLYPKQNEDLHRTLDNCERLLLLVQLELAFRSVCRNAQLLLSVSDNQVLGLPTL